MSSRIKFPAKSVALQEEVWLFSLRFKIALKLQLRIQFFGQNTLNGNKIAKEIDHFT